MELPVKNLNGETIETIELSDAVFNVPMNHALVHQALVIYQLNLRQGTHATKTRGEVSGGGRKPWAQKHTGRARQGSTRAPQWRHGGVVFGPHPRSYRKVLTRRTRRLALRCVLSDKARQRKLVCLDSTNGIDGKTKSMIHLLENLQVSGSALVVTRLPEQQVVRAAHNLKQVWTMQVDLLNAKELLGWETVIITLEAARWVEQLLAVEPHGQRGQRRLAGPAGLGKAQGALTAGAEPTSGAERPPAAIAATDDLPVRESLK